jgi:hypothetical protein
MAADDWSSFNYTTVLNIVAAILFVRFFSIGGPKMLAQWN